MGILDLEIAIDTAVRHERLRKLKSMIVNDDESTVTDPNPSHSHSHSSGKQQPQCRTMDHQLYKAATEGNVDEFITGLERLSTESKVTLTDIFEQLSPLGNTYLHVAASFGHVDLTWFVVQGFCHLLNRTNHKGDTALHLAARLGHMDVVKILVKFRYEDTCVEEGDKKGFIDTNEEGNTPLHEAMTNGCDQVADYLAYELPRAACHVNKEGKSPFFLALEAGNIDTAKAMLSRLRSEYHRKHLDELLDTQGNSLIQAAIFWRNQELMEEIVSFKPALIYSRNEKGQSPLHFASSVGFLAGVRLLLKNFSMSAFERDKDGLCALHIASKKGDIEVIEKLLQHCLDPKEFITPKGENILHVAAKNGKGKMVKYMLKNPKVNSLINEKDVEGNTPLHLAALNWHPKVVSSLTWDKRVNAKLLNNEGLTALDVVEEYMDTMPSYRKRLTWMALMSAGVPRGKHRNNAKLNRLKSTTYEPYNMDYCKDRVNTLLLVSTLIATVTFAAGFTAPGGNNDSGPNRGTATMVNEKMFQIFVVSDTMAMYSSILVVVTLIWAQLGDLYLVVNALKLAIPLLGVSLSMMSLAFMVSVHLLVSKVTWLANFVLMIGAVSISCLLVIFVPLFLPYTSEFRIIRQIYYYPFCLLMLASGCYDEGEQMED